MAIVMRLVQRFQAGKKHEFMELEKQFAALEHRGILPQGKRLTPLASREPGNTLIWEGSFADLAEAEQALKLIETNPDHTDLYNQQKSFFEDTWLEFYEVLNY